MTSFPICRQGVMPSDYKERGKNEGSIVSEDNEVVRETTNKKN